MKRRTSLTLDKRLLDKIDNHVDHKIIKSRTHAIEYFVDKYLEQNRYCVILSGGNPENLYVDELGVYRPLIKIDDKTLIEHAMKKAAEILYKKFLIIGSKKLIEAIKDTIGENQNIIYIEEKKHGKTANTLLLAKDLLKDTFLFLPCDHFFEFDLKKLEYIHKSNDFTVTLAIHAATEPNNIGSLVDLDGNEIIHYWEKPTNYYTFLNSTLIGFAEPRIFSFIERNDCSLQRDVFPKLMKRHELGGAIMSGRFANVHSNKDIENLVS